MAPHNLAATTELYAAILREIKHRLAALQLATGGHTGLPIFAVREFGYSQLRLICELIALGCLVAHGDIAGARSKTLTKEWKADQIIKGLERLHPDFYPLATNQTVSDEDGVNFHFTDVTEPYLTKANLIDLYAACGNALHRGSLRNLTKPLLVQESDIARIRTYNDRIIRLLATHSIILLGGRTVLICALQAANLNDDVSVQVAVAT